MSRNARLKFTEIGLPIPNPIGNDTTASCETVHVGIGLVTIIESL